MSLNDDSSLWRPLLIQGGSTSTQEVRITDGDPELSRTGQEYQHFGGNFQCGRLWANWPHLQDFLTQLLHYR